MNTHKKLARSKSVGVKKARTIKPTIYALQNNEVLSNIMSFLPLKDLKAVREVNHMWKDESQKYFRRRGKVAIDFDDIIEKFEEFDHEFDDYLETSKCHVNFKITQDDDGEMINGDNIVIDPKFQEKIEKFIQAHGANILSLKLGLYGRSCINFKFVSNILKGVPKLVEVNLNLTSHNISLIYSKENEDWLNDFKFLEPLVHLKKLVLHLQERSDWPTFRQFCRKLLQLTPNIEVLDFPCCKMYLEELNEMQLEWKRTKSKELMPFKKLSSYTNLYLTHIEQLLGFELLQPIRKLTISATSETLKENSLQLQELLNKYAKTLESFQFNYHILDKDKNVFVNIGANLELPNMPRLQSMKFCLTGRPRSRRNGVGAFNLINLFMMGGKSFKEKFPLLQSFTWKEPLKVFNPAIYTHILRQPNQDLMDMTFPQFTSVNLSGKCPRHEVYCSKKTYKDWMAWLARIFPNVNNPQFNKARLPLHPVIQDM